MQVLAVGLGGTELRAARVDAAGGLAALAVTATHAAAGPDAVIEQIVALAREVRGDAAIVRLGVAAPGPLDPGAGVVLAAPTLAGWRDVPLAARLKARLGLDVVLENDANAAALGEWRFGAARGTGSMVFVTISTGIGGGVVADGRLLHGRRGLAGEVGHMCVTQADAPCACGGAGCWEAVASGTALVRAGRTLGLADGPAIEAAARAGHRAARALLQQEARWLGIGIANLLHLYSPDCVVLGGGVMACFDMLQAEIRATVDARAMPAYRDVPIRPAALGANAGLIGAASLVL